MNKITKILLKLNILIYIAVLIFLAVIFFGIISMLQSYWYTGVFYNPTLLNIDFINPVKISFFIAFVSIFFISKLKRSLFELEEKNIEMEDKQKAQSDFFASMSHEIRTPMNAIIGMSQILMDDRGLAKRQAETVVTINNSSNMLLGLVNDILDFSKLQAGKLTLENIHFELDMVLNYLADTIGLQIKEKGLELVFSIDHNVDKSFFGDPLRVSQILLNLISNSIKFTDKGSITLVITTLNSTKESSLVQFEMKDTGIGIKKDKLKTLFQNYSQAEDNTSRKYGGTGLGLSIVKQLTSMMDGKVWVESEYGSGTSFFVNVRLKKDSRDKRRKYRLPSEDLMKKKVLIIEPREKSTASLKHMLNYFHISVVTASTVDEGKEYLKDEVFDILFIDEGLHNSYGMNDVALEAIDKKIIIEDWLDSLQKDETEYDTNYKYLKRPFNQQMLFDILLTLYNYKSENRVVDSYSKDDLLQLGKHKILVAEDNIINQKVIKGLLIDTEIEAFCVNNGEELLLKLETSSDEYKVILMDIHMPNLDGYEATRKIRKNTKYDDINIIAHSGDTSNEDIQKSINVGMQDFLAKPIEIKKFYKVLVTHLISK